MQRVPPPDQQALDEEAELQGIDVDKRPQPGIGRVDQLEAPVEPEAVDRPGADPTTQPVTGFEENPGEAGSMQSAGGGETRQPAADNDSVHVGLGDNDG